MLQHRSRSPLGIRNLRREARPPKQKYAASKPEAFDQSQFQAVRVFKEAMVPRLKPVTPNNVPLATSYDDSESSDGGPSASLDDHSQMALRDADLAVEEWVEAVDSDLLHQLEGNLHWYRGLSS
jgi:hypothetical protein